METKIVLPRPVTWFQRSVTRFEFLELGVVAGLVGFLVTAGAFLESASNYRPVTGSMLGDAFMTAWILFWVALIGWLFAKAIWHGGMFKRVTLTILSFGLLAIVYYLLSALPEDDIGP